MRPRPYEESPPPRAHGIGNLIDGSGVKEFYIPPISGDRERMNHTLTELPNGFVFEVTHRPHAQVLLIIPTELQERETDSMLIVVELMDLYCLQRTGIQQTYACSPVVGGSVERTLRLWYIIGLVKEFRLLLVTLS